jgi:osmoprotectant transport system permease protein
MILVNWFLDPTNWQGSAGIPTRLFEHVAMSGASLLTAALIGLPIGLFIGHTGRFANAAINIANIGRAIPSYAVLVIILPISLQFSPDLGLNIIPTFLAMTLLAIPPILVTTYAGIREVDPDLVEAARGMGLREGQILRRLEIPLAIPVIVGGFRTATLQVIATTTIGAVVGGGGLGRFIVDGFSNPSLPGQLYGGVILVAGLAIGTDALLSLVQRRITPRALRGDLGARSGPGDQPSPASLSAAV